jgi:hypothetical protein
MIAAILQHEQCRHGIDPWTPDAEIHWGQNANPCFARTGWNCNKVGVVLVIPSAAVITPTATGESSRIEMARDFSSLGEVMRDGPAPVGRSQV